MNVQKQEDLKTLLQFEINQKDPAGSSDPDILYSEEPTQKTETFHAPIGWSERLDITSYIVSLIGILAILAIVMISKFSKRPSQIFKNSAMKGFRVVNKAHLGPRTFLAQIETEHKMFLLSFHEADFRVLSEWAPTKIPDPLKIENQRTPLSLPEHNTSSRIGNDSPHSIQSESIEKLSALIRDKIKRVR